MNFTTKYPVVVFLIILVDVKIYVMKKFALIIFFFCALSAHAHGVNGHYKSILEKRIKFYPLYYNALQLSKDQISQFEYITETYNNKYSEIIKNNGTTENIRRLSKQEDREIEKFLDKHQKKRYKVIRHLERFDIKKSFKEKDYYKLNPRMGIFGDLPKK